MIRTHHALSVVAAAALLLTACDGDSNDQTGTAETTTESPATAPAEETPDSDDDDDAPEAEEEAFAVAEVTDVAGNPIGTVSAAEAEEGVQVSAEVHSLTPGFRGIAIHENGVCEPQSAGAAGEIGDFYSAGEVLPGDPEGDPGVVEGEEELAETPGEEVPEEQAPEEQAPEEQNPEQPEEIPGEGEQPEAPQGAPNPNAAAGPITVQPAGQLHGEQAGQGVLPPQSQAEEEADIVRSERAGALPNLLVNDDGTGHLEVVSARLSEELLLDDEATAVIIYTAADHHGNVPERYAPYGPDADSLATGDAGQRAACGVLEPTG